MWQPIREQKAVWVPERNGDFALCGALDICTGDTYVETFDHEVSILTIDFLERIQSQTTGKVLLVWDQAS